MRSTNTLGIQFIIRKSKTKDGQAPIYVKVTGYIQCMPSYNPHKGSLINLYTFSKGSDNGNEIAMRPFINNGIVGYFFYILFINFLFCSPLNFLELLQLIAAHCSNVSIPFFHSTHAIQSRGSGGVLVYC